MNPGSRNPLNGFYPREGFFVDTQMNQGEARRSKAPPDSSSNYERPQTQTLTFAVLFFDDLVPTYIRTYDRR